MSISEVKMSSEGDIVIADEDVTLETQPSDDIEGHEAIPTSGVNEGQYVEDRGEERREKSPLPPRMKRFNHVKGLRWYHIPIALNGLYKSQWRDM